MWEFIPSSLFKRVLPIFPCFRDSAKNLAKGSNYSTRKKILDWFSDVVIFERPLN